MFVGRPSGSATTISLSQSGEGVSQVADVSVRWNSHFGRVPITGHLRCPLGCSVWHVESRFGQP